MTFLLAMGTLPCDVSASVLQVGSLRTGFTLGLDRRLAFVLAAHDVKIGTHADATLDLTNTSVQGTGPTGPSATLTYDLRFKPQAAGRTFRVEVMLVDDFGAVQGFEQIGTVSVVP